MLTLNWTNAFSNSVPRIIFFANLIPKFESALLEMKIGTKRYLVVLISRLTIVSLILFLKKPFWEILVSKLESLLF